MPKRPVHEHPLLKVVDRHSFRSCYIIYGTLFNSMSFNYSLHGKTNRLNLLQATTNHL